MSADPDFAVLDDCDWYVNKKTGKAERLYSSPIMLDGPGNMHHRDMETVRDLETTL
ncbi:hypothetical protein KIH77_05215 [Bifidobacterium sp. 82T24]|nr:hypothetical protein [Bifidobacterium pluvialisilvae]